MIKTLAKSIREYKKPSLLTPIFVSGEVILECIIPFLIANLVNEIKAGCSMNVLLGYGAVLIVMAALSQARPAPRQAAASRATCARICSTKFKGTRSKISTASPSQASSHV